MTKPKITICTDATALALNAAQLISLAAKQSISARGKFTLVLAGGSTPEKTYELLGNVDKQTDVDWQSTYLFFGDERFVPHDDPRSNFGMARRTLTSRVPLPPEHIFAIPTHFPTAAASAAQYAESIARFFGIADAAAPPVFDLVLLGLGDDGHTASLFPEMPALSVADRWTAATPPGRLPPPIERITLTFPLLNSARQILFLVAGANKAQVVREIFQGSPPISHFPAAGIRPSDGTVEWLLDQAAARALA